jgi:pimeloyl-ACP methyl ester carboxylesterase
VAVVPIVRASDKAAASGRFREAVEAAAHDFGLAPPRSLEHAVDPIVGDLCDDALQEAASKHVEAGAEFWHLAATPEPSDPRQDRALLTAALRLALSMRCNRLVVVARDEPGTDDTDNWLSSTCKSRDLTCLTLHLPNLLGASLTSRVGDTRRGVFGLAAGQRALAPDCANVEYPFACVDHVVHDMIALAAPSEGTSSRFIAGAVAWSGTTINRALAPLEPSPCAHGSPLRPLSIHAATAVPPGRPRITEDDLEAHLASWRAESQQRSPWRRLYIPAEGAARVTSYHFAADGGSGVRRPVAILVNAYGVPAEALTLLAETLSSEVRVVTWATRGLPDLSESFDPLACGLAQQSDDLASVLDAYDASRAHIIGWCTGGMVAAQFVWKHPERALSLTMINPSIPLWPDAMTGVQVAAARTFGPLSRTRRSALLGFQLLHMPPPPDVPPDAPPGVPPDVPPDVKAANTASSPNAAYTGLFLSSNKTQLRFARGPSRHPEALYRYSCMGKSYFVDSPAVPLAELRARTLVIGATDDPLTGNEAAKRAAALIPGAEYQEFVGTHFDVCTRLDVTRRAKQFVLVGAPGAPSSIAADEGRLT